MRRILVDTADGPWLSDAELGESIAVDGACMTVVSLDGARFAFEASPESLARTTLGSLTEGHRVHLERAMVAGGRLGGHLVQGHVDGVGELVARQDVDGAWRMVFSAPAGVSRYLVPKGSITISGISLTVNEVDGQRFSVMIVPHTGTHTTVLDWVPGTRVNLEADIVGKYVEKLLTEGVETPWSARGGGGVTHELLQDSGFINGKE